AVLCPASREEVQVRTRADVGTGDAALQTFVGTAPPSWSNGLDRVALSEAMANALSIEGAGYQPEGSPERVRLGGRAVRVREFDLVAGTCTRFAVSAGGALPMVALALRAPNSD